MKKIIFLLIVIIAASCVTMSCSNDDDSLSYSRSQTPSQEIEGTYSGTFTRVLYNSPSAVPESGEGKLVITSTESSNRANVQFTCEPLNIATATIPVNVTFENDGLLFYNHSTSNLLGSVITGRIDGSKKTISKFQVKIRIGRSTKTYDVFFSGSKM